jgi:hypothetical protein
MLKDDRTFTSDEVRVLVSYAQSIVFDAVQSRPGPRLGEEVSLRLVRRYARALMCPDLIVNERPPWSQGGKKEALNREDREYWYWFLGDRSRRVTSMSDVELYLEVERFVRGYR